MKTTEKVEKKEEVKQPLTKDQIRDFAVSKLMAFFRHLEKAGLLSKEIASVYIGKVKILGAMAKGEFKER